MDLETVGILSPGEMGSAIARRVAANGLRPITAIDGRSRATRDRATAAGIEVVGSAADLVVRSDAILSVVPPSAAIAVARTVAAGCQAAEAVTVFADLNAVGPATVTTIDNDVLAECPVVDGCIIGPARDLDAATVYLAGPTADDLATIAEYGLGVEVLGDRIGQASGLKLCYAGMTKGVMTLGLDLLLAAVELEVADDVIALYRDRLPEIAGLLDARLPGSARRAGRRSDEMAELAETLESLAIGDDLFHAARLRLAWLDALGLETDDAGTAVETARRIAKHTSRP